MTIKVNAQESQIEGLAVSSVKLVTAVAVFLVLMTTVIGSVARVRASSGSTGGALSHGPHTVLPGTLVASETTTLAVDFAARVAEVSVAPGATVEAGQVLAALESPEITLDEERSKARLDRAAAKLEAIRSTGGDDLGAKIRREEFETAQAAWTAAKGRVEAYDIDGPQAAYKEAKERVAQMRGLLERHLVTSTELEQSLREEQGELRNLQTALEHYSRLKQEAEEAESRLRITRMRMEQGEGSEAISARQEYDDARIVHELATKRLADLRVVAPRPGTVLNVNISAGDRTLAGMPLIHLSDLSTLRAEVSVAPKIARQIAVGTPVEVRVPTEPPQVMSSAVQSVLLVPESRSQGYVVRIRIPNPEPGIILAGLDCAVVFPHVETGESWIDRLF